jgi:predicted amidohydrolase YtcJ
MEAHLTVIDRDITAIPTEDIMNAKVIMTVISGEIVFEDR